MSTGSARKTPAAASAEDSAILALMPPRLREIADVVGVDATLALTQAVGGLRLHVPASVDADHPIAQAMGLEKAQALCKAFGLHYFPVPRGHLYKLALVRTRALERYYGGEPAASVAKDLGLHEITIYNWAGAEKRAMTSTQPGLF